MVLVYDYNCSGGRASDYYISKKTLKNKNPQAKPNYVFNKNLSVKSINLPKRLGIKLSSPGSHWAYGLAIHLRELGRKPCVVR